MPAAKPAGDKYFELTTEVEIPEPMKVPLAGNKSVLIQPPTRKQLKLMTVATTIDAKDEAIIGEHYAAIAEFYDDKPYQEWNAFTAKVSKHFFGPGADDVEGKSQDSSD